jgi:acylpyruvate hydrolase
MKIICIGRNYALHAKEMGSETTENPLFFLKPDSAILPKRNPFFIPNFSNEIHHEIELIIKINKLGKTIDEKFAHTYYDEIGLGIDFTARDLQAKCKELGHPWEMAKAFDQSAVVSENFIKKTEFSGNNISFHLTKNKEIIQEGNGSDMVFSPEKIISYVSKFMTLKIGDLIFTGTPAGVGKVEINDELEGFIEGKSMFKVKIK